MYTPGDDAHAADMAVTTERRNACRLARDISASRPALQAVCRDDPDE